jgi:hypothetical protein
MRIASLLGLCREDGPSKTIRRGVNRTEDGRDSAIKDSTVPKVVQSGSSARELQHTLEELCLDQAWK